MAGCGGDHGSTKGGSHVTVRLQKQRSSFKQDKYCSLLHRYFYFFKVLLGQNDISPYSPSIKALRESTVNCSNLEFRINAF